LGILLSALIRLLLRQMRKFGVLHDMFRFSLEIYIVLIEIDTKNKVTDLMKIELHFIS
jgi:hypothetical protein